MCRCKSLAQLLTWHKDGTNTYGLVRSVVGENTINYTQKIIIIHANIFLHINSRKLYSQNIFNHYQTIMLLNSGFIICCIQSLRDFRIIKVSEKYF